MAKDFKSYLPSAWYNDKYVNGEVYLMVKHAYEDNYRKLPEDSVVISREEYKKLKSLPNKIIKYMDRHLGNGELCGNVVRNCAKQFGVEIKENNNER